MLVITGATGNIGSKITTKLLDEGKKVGVIGRDMNRLKTFVDRGAEPFVGDLTDTAFLTRAFKGATAVFALIPPDMSATDFMEYDNKIGESIAMAIRNANVKQVVNLSSLGAHLGDKSGIVRGLRDQEERLNKIPGLNVVHLRPAYFMENLLSTIDMLKTQNMIGLPLDGAVRFPMIATKDIADVACDYLTNPTFTGHTVRNLLGQRDVNYNEIVKVIGNAIGQKDIKYVNVPYDEALGNMVKWGISDSVASGLNEMMKRMNEGTLQEGAKRTKETTTPTTLEDFASGFARIYRR